MSFKLTHRSTLRQPARTLIGLAVLLLIGLFSPLTRAHDIPDQILLQGYVKPDAERLHFVVRIPLVMLLNLNLPKRGPGFIALEHIDEALQKAAAATAREIPLYENGVELRYSEVTARISQPSDESFASFGQALALLDGPPPDPATNVFWNQGYFDAHFQYPINSPSSDFSLDLQVAPGLAKRLKLIAHFLPPEGTERIFEIHYGSGPVFLDPHWYQAAWTFVKLGCGHILDGIDHLLFLLCLVAPFRLRHLWSLVAVITSFTIAHSVTLIAAAFGLVPQGNWFPPLVEVLIAVSILYMAIENVVATDLRHRWLISGAFGLIHGFGFSFVLQQDLQLAGSHLLLSLLAFNVGVEIGQLLFLLAVLPILSWLFKTARAEKYGLIIISILVGHTAWHWLLERYDILTKIPLPDIRDEIDPVVAGWMVGLTVLVILLLLTARQRFMLTGSKNEPE
jgi:hypothetical protein